MRAGAHHGARPDRCGTGSHTPRARRLVRAWPGLILFDFQARLFPACPVSRAACHCFRIFMDALIQTITVYALPVLFGITLHEAAHGYVARMFGDPTAWQAGRISLNPIRHIDPVGTIVVPLVLLFS